MTGIWLARGAACAARRTSVNSPAWPEAQMPDGVAAMRFSAAASSWRPVSLSSATEVARSLAGSVYRPRGALLGGAVAGGCAVAPAVGGAVAPPQPATQTR